jgi:hypothetical protein
MSTTLWSIGHSTHTAEELHRLLALHIDAAGRVSAHALTPFAAVDADGQITYPAS